MQYDLKKLLAIIYLRTYKDCYQYVELKELLGFNTTQLKAFLISLEEESLIVNSNSLKLTDKSINILKEMQLIDVDINSLMEDKKTISTNLERLSFDDIYIPKNFKLR